MLLVLSLTILISSLTLINNNIRVILEWSLIKINSSSIIMPIYIDPQGTLFRRVVCFISRNVLLFSDVYIKEEKYLARFIHLVLLFIISINLLIFIPRIIFLLLGWDGLGIIRFLLVIYYQNSSSLAAGIITALTNRIGDVLILLRIAYSLSVGQWSLVNIFLDPPFIVVITIIMIAAITKRAQIPFSSWLPAAIAAPTPVSALVHSSTLVTAGVFLIYRFYNCISIWKWFNLSLFIIGRVTILIAGTAAIVEVDIKKIIALSTLSQLGVIIATLGIGIPRLAFFHLITHALFKALLFICAGTLINFHGHTQELRAIGNSIPQLPLLSLTLLSANLALCGSPFMAGFYSKDYIIETILFNSPNIIIYFIFLFGTVLTATYSTRFRVLVIISKSLSSPLNPMNDNYMHITVSSVLLGIGAITAGALISWFFITPSIEPILIFQDKIFALIRTIRGVYLGWKISIYRYYPWTSIYKNIRLFFSLIWKIKPLSTQILLPYSYYFRKSSIAVLDQGWFEIYGPQNSLLLLNKASNISLLIQKLPILSIVLLRLNFILWILF